MNSFIAKLKWLFPIWTLLLLVPFARAQQDVGYISARSLTRRAPR